jgi:two-component system nitrogen regulation response regulator GlnG
VLSDGHFYRVGGHSAIKANVRVIAATHQDLELRVQQGAFREDLFHRLNVIRLRLPALRERRQDIPTLTRHFLQHSAKQLGVEPKRIADSALAAIENFAFPGNVRQLENVCHWLTVMAPAQVIEPKDLPPEFGVYKHQSAVQAPSESASDGTPMVRSNGSIETLHPRLGVPLDGEALPEASIAWPLPETLALTATTAPPLTGWEVELEDEALTLLRTGHVEVWDTLTRRFEARMIAAALTNTRGRRIEAATKLGIGRNTITRKIQELGLDKKLALSPEE